MKPYRSRRVAEQIKREIAEILQASKSWLGGCILTVTEVRLSPDLKYADVWISVYGDKGERDRMLRSLKSNTGRIRHQLAGRMTIRHIPELRFDLDQTLDYADRIDTLLKEDGISKGNTEPDEREIEG